MFYFSWYIGCKVCVKHLFILSLFQAIRNINPDIVMVELCKSRVHILKHDEKTLLEEARDINLAKVRFGFRKTL